MIEDHLWLIAKFMPNARIELVEDDVVRFGRMTFVVRSICFRGPNDPETLSKGPGTVYRSVIKSENPQQVSEVSLR